MWPAITGQLWRTFRHAACCNAGVSTACRLALVVIARNESPRIARLLHSVAPWVDRMCVLDTGSSDDTAAVAAACGAQVAHFGWCDDFAAARNAALDFARADWHLVLDADEWLLAGGPALRQMAAVAPDVVGTVQLEDRFGADGSGRAAHRLSRLLPGHVRYAGRVHEQPVHDLRLRHLAVQVAHDGYSPAALAAKRGRNRQLLLAELTTQPSDAYLWFQLGKDAAVYGEHALAAQALARADMLLTQAAVAVRATAPTAAGARVTATASASAASAAPEAATHAPWHADLVARRLHSLQQLHRHADAQQFAAAAIARSALCAASPDVHFALGAVLLDRAALAAALEPALATQHLAGAQAAWSRCLQLGERPDIAGAVQGRGSTLAAFNLALLLEGTGRAGDARRLRSQHGLDTQALLDTGDSRSQRNCTQPVSMATALSGRRLPRCPST